MCVQESKAVGASEAIEASAEVRTSELDQGNASSSSEEKNAPSSSEDPCSYCKPKSLRLVCALTKFALTAAFSANTRDGLDHQEDRPASFSHNGMQQWNRTLVNIALQIRLRRDRLTEQVLYPQPRDRPNLT